ncbi:MAG: phosphoribosylanthranilate isomerase [Cryomorphaceae bacterium]
MSLQVKICGMRQVDNVKAIGRLSPDLMGFILYPPSPRFVQEKALNELLRLLSDDTSAVAVFVNETAEEMIRICKEYGFNYAQLHGAESVEICQKMKAEGIGVIKAFQVSDSVDLELLQTYEPFVDYFLFDTKTKNYGGSGKQFDWNLLSSYSLATPYFLSGGIGETDIETILNSSLPGCVGIDANSRLEIKPGLKNVEEAAKLINQIRKR